MTLGRPVLFTLCALATGACTEAPPPGRPPVPAADYDRVVEENGELRERLAELEAREVVAPARAVRCPDVEEVRLELRETARALSTERSAAGLYAARAAEYEEGLARCVESLNTVQASRRIVIGEGQRAERPPSWSAGTSAGEGAARPAAPARREPARALQPVRAYSAPDVDVAGESIVISARLYNPEPVDQRVTVEIALTVDGVVRDSETQGLMVPASGAHAVAATFHLRSYRGAIAGRVRVLE